jgi:membrane protein DedA with SNARE-associated domain
MLGLIDKHSYIAIILAVALEELGIPMPIPTDLLIVFAGIKGAGSPTRLAIWFGLLNLASALGASGLYAVVRRGGRPLVDRFGRYVHLGPKQLTRAENLLKRGGWTTIAVARAIPGLRYLAVVGCGLLNIPYTRFITAHIVGSSVYIGVFLWLGALFGPAVLRYVHLPAVELRLVWLLLLAIGLPLLLAWFCYRGHAEYTVAPSRRRTLSAILLASFAGTTALGASWAAAASLTEVLGEPRPLNVVFSLADVLLGRGLRPSNAYMVVYSALLVLCVGVGVVFYEVILPWVAPRGTTLVRQALGLTLMGVVLVCAFLVPAILAAPNGPILRWWRSGSPPLLALALLVGIICYALTTTCARALAIAILPSLRRSEKLPIVAPPPAPNGKVPTDSHGKTAPAGGEPSPAAVAPVRGPAAGAAPAPDAPANKP